MRVRVRVRARAQPAPRLTSRVRSPPPLPPRSWHPNIDMEGNVCLNILRAEWTPVLDIHAVINGLCFLFYEPNPNDPLNQDAAKQLREDPAGFDRDVAASLRGGSVKGHRFEKLV